MGFSGNGSMLTAPMVQEGGVAAVVQDYSWGMRIPSEVSSSSHPPKEAGSSILASVEAEEDGTGRGRRQQQHGDEEDDDDSELELGLSLGAKKATGNSGASRNAAGGGAPWGEYCRILTAKDFPSIMVASRGSPISSSSSTASSSPSLDGSGGGGVGRAGVGVAGTKRAADFVSPEVGSRAAPSPVVGWPPIRAFRMNSLMNQSRDSSEEDSNKNNGDNGGHDKATGRNASILRSGVRENGVGKEHEKKGPLGGSPFVKANMDGMPIGRKVDLSAHHTYETLAMALEDMFQDPSSPSYPIRTAGASNLLDGSSEFVLTYKDKDGDWMLVGDVPWGMFLGTVKRLRIMRASNATGLGPECRSSRVGGFRRCHV